MARFSNKNAGRIAQAVQDVEGLAGKLPAQTPGRSKRGVFAHQMLGVMDEDVDAGSTGDCTIWAGDPVAATAVSRTVEAWGGDLKEDDRVFVVPTAGRLFAAPLPVAGGKNSTNVVARATDTLLSSSITNIAIAPRVIWMGDSDLPIYVDDAANRIKAGTSAPLGDHWVIMHVRARFYTQTSGYTGSKHAAIGLSVHSPVSMDHTFYLPPSVGIGVSHTLSGTVAIDPGSLPKPLACSAGISGGFDLVKPDIHLDQTSEVVAYITEP